MHDVISQLFNAAFVHLSELLFEWAKKKVLIMRNDSSLNLLGIAWKPRGAQAG